MSGFSAKRASDTKAGMKVGKSLIRPSKCIFMFYIIAQIEPNLGTK